MMTKNPIGNWYTGVHTSQRTSSRSFFRLTNVLIVLLMASAASAQQSVFWRNEAANGNWENGNCNNMGTANSQWWYTGFTPNNARNRPDCNDGSTNRHNVTIDNNHQPTMTLNTAFWGLRSLTLANTATSGRTLNGSPDDGTRGISITNGIYNNANSGVTHNFNVRIGIDANPCTLRTLTSGAITNYNREIFGNSNAIVFDGSGATNSTAVISGTGASVSKQGSGTLTLSGTNSYTGNTTISAGTLQTGAANALSSSSNIVLSGGTLRTGSAAGFSQTAGTIRLTASSAIALGTGSHNLNFAASSAESWTASTLLTITGWTGTNDGNSSGTAGRIFAGNSSGGLNPQQLSQMVFDISGTLYSAVQLSTGEVVPSGSRPLYFGGAAAAWNTSNWSTNNAAPYTSNWTSGRHAIFNIASTSMTGASVNFPRLTANANVTLSSTSGTIGTSSQNANITVASGVLLDFSTQSFSTSSSFGITKNGPGTMALAGNTYGGGFTLNAGTVVARGVNAMGGNSSPGALNINGGTIAGSDNRDFSGKYSAINAGGDFTLGSGTAPASASANLIFNTGVNLGSSSTRTITMGGTGTYTLNGAISGSGSNLVINATAAGTLSLGGASTYGGSTTINGGTVNLTTGSNRLPTGTALTLANNAGVALNLNNNNQQVASLAGGGASGGNISLGSATLTVSQNSNTTYGGVISGAGALTKSGTGTLILSRANSYSGLTTVSGGVLELGAANVLAAGNMVLSGGSLSTGSGNGFSETLGTLQLTANSGITLGTGNHTLNFISSNATTWTAARTLTITGWSASGGKIFFGNSSAGLTSTQLGQISFSGFPGPAHLLSTGELIPTQPPSVTSFSVGAPGSGTSGYPGNVITVTGTNLLGVTEVRIGGSGGTLGTGLTVVNSTTITFTAPAASGQIYVANGGGNATSSASYTSIGYITAANGTWSTSATWFGGAVPPSGANAVINHDVTISSGTINVGALTINSGKTLSQSAGTLNIASNSVNSGTLTLAGTLGLAATYTNNGVTNANGTVQINTGGFADGTGFVYGAASTLIFNHGSGRYGVGASHAYWPFTNGPFNVTVNGSGNNGIQLQNGVARTVAGTFTLNQALEILDAGGLTLNGTLILNTNSFIDGNSPVFGAASTLNYNAGASYNVSYEWTSNGISPGAGIPNNVTITNNTTVNMPTGDRGLAGNLTITSGNLVLNGSNGDLYVRGNFTQNSTFTANNRAVFFNGGGAQSLSGTGSIIIPYFFNVNTAGTLTISSSLNVPVDFNTLAGSSTSMTSGNLTVGAVSTIAGSVSLGTSGNVSLNGPTTVSGSLNLGASVFSCQALSLTGTGSMVDNNNSGTDTFIGLLTIGNGCSFTGLTTGTIGFRSGIVNNGTINLTGATAVSFNTNNQSISGSGNTQITSVQVTGVVLTNSGTMTVSTALEGSTAGSEFVNAANAQLNFAGTTLMNTGIFTASAAGNTVNYSSTASQTIRAVTAYGNLTVSGGSGIKTLAANTIINGTVSVAASTTMQCATLNLTAGSITTAGTFSKSGAGSVLVSGSTEMTGSGVVTITSATFEMQGGVVFNSSGNSAFSGINNFAVNNQTISGNGTGTLTFATVNLQNGISVTSQRAVTISTNLDGVQAASQWINDNGATLNYAASATFFNTAGSLNAAVAGNTVNFSGATQTIKPGTYHHLGITALGTKNISDVTVNGNFNYTNGTIVASGSITFSSATPATFTTTAVPVYSNIVVDKAGSSLTLAGSGVSIGQNLQIQAGSFVFGTTARTVSVSGDLSGAGILDMSGNSGHIINLAGASNNIGSLLSVAGSSVNYTRSGNQSVFGSPNYAMLNLNGPGTKSLNGPVSVSDTVRLIFDQILDVGNHNLTLKAGARLRSGAAGNNQPFSLTRMILTSGTGNLIVEGANASAFTGFCWSSAGKGNGLIPVGTSGYYSPMQISSLAATVSGTGSISVRAVPEKQPNVPYYFNALNKYWDVQSSNLSGISAGMNFTFNAGEVVGNQALYVGRVWNGSALATPAGLSAVGSNPFGTSGSSFISGQWTAIDAVPRNIFYSYISGNWNSASTWTTDPSGSTLINSAVPSAGDQVVILNGRTVTVSAATSSASLEIENGAVLDLGSSSGNSFGPISGSGLLRLSSINLPASNFNSFIAAGGGTVEYYNLPAGANVLASGLTTYNNLVVSNSSGTSFTLVQNHNLTLNGNLSFSRSDAGSVTYQLGNSASARTLSIGGDLNVAAGCSLTIGTTNAGHFIVLQGSLTNDGYVSLTNGTAYSSVSNGYSAIAFQGAASNTTVTCNSGSFTRFHDFIVQKNTGYELAVNAAAGASPQFWANGNTINPQSGILRLGANVVVSQLTSGGNYDIGTSSAFPVLWIDGATVDYGGSSAIVIFGTLRISAGTLNVTTGFSSIVPRENGAYIQEGGTVNAAMFRPSTSGNSRAAFTMSGGVLNLNALTGSPTSGYSVFTLPYAESPFKMSGGTINMTRSSSLVVGGIQIASAPENYEVTGGTININLTPGLDFDIASTAPLYNLSISKNSGAASSVRLNGITGSGGNQSIAAQPLKILGDFTINGANSPVFNAQNSNVLVSGNVTVESGATWQSATNTTTFEGAANQTFTLNGSLNTGLSSLTVNKAGSSLTLAGSASTFTLRGGLSIQNGTLSDGGKTLAVAGNIFNEGFHSGSGKIVLNSTTAAQTISGADTAVFGNLEFNNTNGATGSEQVQVLSRMQVNGNLTLTSDRLVNIGKWELALAASSQIIGTFSANRFIKTSGLRSDGGIRKPFNSTAGFTFPFGSGTNYTPATVQFSSAPATWGTVTLRPIATRQLYVTSTDAFPLYWRLQASGFSGIPANSVNYTFGYGNLTDNTSYIPAYYNDVAIAYTPINNVNLVNETSNTISFTGVSYTTGDYTAGNPTAFGIVVPFYSRQNGGWNTPATWSNAGFGGAAASSIPSSNSPVLIGNGSTFNHTVTVNTDNTVSGSLIVDAGSVLNCQSTRNNNFGAIPYATAGGSGRIRISSNQSTAEFPGGDFGLFFLADGGTCEYYCTAGQDFTLPTTTDAPNSISIDSYRNLEVNASAGDRITMPDKDLLVFGNMTVNGSSTGTARLNDVASRTLTIMGNLNVNSGILRFRDSSPQTVIVKGNTRVESAGELSSNNSGSITHTLRLEGNLFNEGVIEFNNDSRVNLIFEGNSSVVFNGNNPSALADLRTLTLNKGNSQALQLDITMAGEIDAPSNNWLTLQNGTFIWRNENNITLTNQAGSDFQIPATAALLIDHAGAEVRVGDVDSPNADLDLAGTLRVNAGRLDIGDPGDNQNHDIVYSSAGQPVMEVGGTGIVNVNGQIRRSLFSQLGSLKYSQSGTSQVLVRGKNSDPAGSLSLNRAKFELANSGSQFNMSGNAVLTIDRSGLASGASFGDVFMNAETANVTGGEIRIGTSATPAFQNFGFYTSNPLWSLSVDGNTNAKTLSLNGNPISLKGNLRIEGNSAFNTNGLNVSIAGNFVNQNSTSTSGLTVGGYRTMNATQVTTFNGTSAQTVTGTAANLTNFAGLVISNPAGLNLAATAAPIRVNADLQILAGNFNTADNLATVTGNVENNGSHSSSGAGFLVLGGTSGQLIGGSATPAFGSIRLANAAGAEMVQPIRINGTLNLQNGLFYINNHLLTLGTSAQVSGTFTSTCMIRTNGVASDAGVRKEYPASASDFTFPIGVTFKYTPVRVNVTSNTTAGSVILKPVNTRHLGTTNILDKELAYHWRMSSAGFSGTTAVTHTFNYLQTDASNGNESAYVGGRFLSGDWTPISGIAGAVNAAANTISLNNVNYFDGDYTAGEASEFSISTVYYSRNATSGGNWSDPASWSVDPVLQHAGAAAAGTPSFHQVVIAAGHTINADGDGRNAESVVLNGTLNLDNSIGHNLGTVTGNGTIRQEATVTNQYIFPGGDFAAFTGNTGGTFEYSGTVNGTLPTQASYRNILFSGSAVKSLPNADLSLGGNLTITAGIVNNPSAKNLEVFGNWENQVGISGFSAGAGASAVILKGASQTLTGSTTFRNLQADGIGNKTLTSSMSVSGQLSLSRGIFETGANQLTINTGGSVSGGSDSSHVNGLFRKGIPSSTASVNFEVGDGTVYAPVSLQITGSTNNAGFITASSVAGDHPTGSASGVNPDLSVNRHWILTNSGVTGIANYRVQMTYKTSDLDAGTTPSGFVIVRNDGSSWTTTGVNSVNETSAQTASITGSTLGAFFIGNPFTGRVWSGSVNTNWNVPGNWVPASLPTANDDAIISNVPNRPVLTPGTNACRKLVLMSGASMEVPAGLVLNVHDDITGNGNTVTGLGAIRIGGADVQFSGSSNFAPDLEIASGAALVLGAASRLELQRNLTVSGSGTLNAVNGVLAFTGPDNSSITGNLTIASLEINKAGNIQKLSLGSNISVSNQLNMVSGDLDLNGFQLDLGSTGNLVNETAVNSVTGLAGGSIRAVRSLNAPSEVNVAGLGAVLSSSQNMGSTEVIRRHNQVVFGAGYGINRRYEIHPTNNSGLNATFVFNYFDHELSNGEFSTLEADLELWRFNGTLWESQSASLDETANTLTKSGIPQFSEWTAAGMNTPLPLEVAEMKVSCAGVYPRFSWNSLKEVNTSRFIVETSEDGRNWETVGTIKAAGNSAEVISYSFELKGNPAQLVRLSAQDLDGTQRSFPVVAVPCAQQTAMRSLQIVPNPNDGLFAIQAEGSATDEVLDIRVINTLGQEVAAHLFNPARASLKIDIRDLPKGIYQLQVRSEESRSLVSSFNVLVK